MNNEGKSIFQAQPQWIILCLNKELKPLKHKIQVPPTVVNFSKRTHIDVITTDLLLIAVVNRNCCIHF